jgi:hypothetical protein
VERGSVLSAAVKSYGTLVIYTRVDCIYIVHVHACVPISNSPTENAQNFGNVFSRISSSTMTKQPPETAPAKIPSPGDAALKAEPSLHLAKAWDLTTNPPTNSVKVTCCMFHKGLRIESFANRRMFHFNRVTLSPTFSVELDVV